MARVRDVIVIGGGHNGLACAAYLARAGLDVLVLERREVLGGAAVTDEPWPGYQVSSAAYVVSLMPPEVVQELELRRFGYRVSLIDPDYYVPYPDGSSLTMWADTKRTVEEIAKFSQKDAAAYADFQDYFQQLTRLLRDLLFVVPPNLTRGDLPRWISFAGKLRRWRRRDVVEAVRLFSMSAADLLDEWFDDERVKGALVSQAIIGAWGGPMSPGSAYVLMHHWIGEVDGHDGAWGWVHGGMGSLSECIAGSARAAGAEVRVSAPVRRVVVHSGRVGGVELVDGTELRARRVVSAVHPVTTYLELVGEAFLPDEVVADVRRYRTRSGSVKVNLALGELPVPRVWDGPVPGDPHRSILAVCPSVEYLERAWDDAKYGRTSRHPYVEAVFPTVFEPGVAPPGKHLALCFTQFGPYELADGSWDTERSAYGAKIVATLAEYCPNLPAAVEEMEVLSPPDMEERYGLLGGNIFHGEMSLDQMFSLRPIPGYADYRAPIAGLYLCGSGTHPGGGVTGIPARNCARVIRRDASRERLRRRLMPGTRRRRTA